MGGHVLSVTGASGAVILGTVYRVAGPLPVGAVLRRVRVGWSTAGTTLLSLALALVSSDQETLANLNAGRSLIASGGSRLGNLPAVVFESNTGNAGVFDLFWGLPLLGTERYVLAAVNAASTTGHGNVVFSAELLPGE